jgi:hypothetical protein
MFVAAERSLNRNQRAESPRQGVISVEMFGVTQRIP